MVTEVPRYIEKRPIQPTERRAEDPWAGCANLLCLAVTVVWQTPATSARALLPWKPNTPAGRGAAVGDRRNWQSTRVGRNKSSFWRSTRAHVARHVVVAETSSVIGGGGRGRRSKSIHPGTIPTGSPPITPCPASRFPTGSSGGLSFENSNMAAPVSRSPASPLSAAGPSPLWGSPTARGESTNATPTRRTARTAEGGARTTAFVARAFPGEGPPAPRHATVSNHSAVSISHDQMWEDLTTPSETRTLNLDDVTLIQMHGKWHSRDSVHHLDT